MEYAKIFRDMRFIPREVRLNVKRTQKTNILKINFSSFCVRLNLR